jgi:FlaG/FlaF family flagellin (archaellin)
MEKLVAVMRNLCYTPIISFILVLAVTVVLASSLGYSTSNAAF